MYVEKINNLKYPFSPFLIKINIALHHFAPGILKSNLIMYLSISKYLFVLLYLHSIPLYGCISVVLNGIAIDNCALWYSEF